MKKIVKIMLLCVMGILVMFCGKSNGKDNGADNKNDE